MLMLYILENFSHFLQGHLLQLPWCMMYAYVHELTQLFICKKPQQFENLTICPPTGIKWDTLLRLTRIWYHSNVLACVHSLQVINKSWIKRMWHSSRLQVFNQKKSDEHLWTRWVLHYIWTLKYPKNISHV